MLLIPFHSILTLLPNINSEFGHPFIKQMPQSSTLHSKGGPLTPSKGQVHTGALASTLKPIPPSMPLHSVLTVIH